MLHATGPDRFTARTVVDGRTEDATIHVSVTGRVRDVRSDRWGNPLRQPYGRYPFGVSCHGETTYAGITVPAEISAGWFAGTDRWPQGEFYRARITGLTPAD